jgi:hypothetical protein
MLQRVKDHPNLARDKRSGALINVNNDCYYAAMARKRKARQEKEELALLRNEVNELKALIIQMINTNND